MSKKIWSAKLSVFKHLPEHIEQPLGQVNRKSLASIAVLSCLVLQACSVSSPLNNIATEDTVINASVTKPVEPQGIDSTDAEIIKTVVAESDKTNALAWSNPDTGTKGTITAIDRFTGSHGQNCKKFQTTVDTFMGISLYNGETCELKKGFWVLSWFLKQEG